MVVSLSDVASLRRTGHFTYESGHHGDTWLALDRLFLDQHRLQAIAGALADKLRPYGIDAICGPLVGGALLGQWVAHHLDLPFTYAERIPPDAATPARYAIPADLAGAVAGRRLAVVDDAINAGAATLAAAAEIARLGGTTTVAATIFIRAPGGVELLRHHGLSCEYLLPLDFQIWEPASCPLCADDVPLTATSM